MAIATFRELLPGIFRFEDTCNVYVLAGEAESLAIDYGSGAWRETAASLGLPPLRQVLLTHHHPDQCAGLETAGERPFAVHAPAGEAAFLEPAQVAAFWAKRRDGGVPASYAVLERGIAGVVYDLQGFADFWWGNRRLRLLHTPGHGRHALSVVADVAGKQVVFCGDAVHAGATIHQPYCLEWDHWTGSGALAAWEGIERLGAIGMDLLCPSHGPVIDRQPRQLLRQLGRKLLAFYRAKGSICSGERDRYVTPTRLACGANRLSASLYQFGTNGYLLLGDRDEGLVVDPTLPDLSALDALLDELGNIRPTAATATHYHYDHCDGLPVLRERFGATAWLHPEVAAPLAEIGAIDCPWLTPEPIVPDRLLPDGDWRWNRYTFRVAAFPGQTRWHACLMTEVDSRRVFFGGDSFQPNSRWNGTGGFCAFNGSHFSRGFVPSARLVIDWQPEWLATGHGTTWRYRRSHFERIVRWARQAEAATRALCPSGDLDTDYYLHPAL